MGIWFCEMEFNCPKQWENLKRTADDSIRDCDECGKSVHFIDTQEELRDAAEAGKCVAFYKYTDEEIPLRDRLELRRLYVSTRPVRQDFMTLGLPSSANRSGGQLRSFIDTMNDDQKKTDV